MANNFGLGTASKIINGLELWYTTPGGVEQRIIKAPNGQYFYDGLPWQFPTGVTESDLKQESARGRFLASEEFTLTDDTNLINLPNIPEGASSALVTFRGFGYISSNTPGLGITDGVISPNTYDFFSRDTLRVVAMRLPTAAEAVTNPLIPEATSLQIYTQGNPVTVHVAYYSKQTDHFRVVGPPFSLQLASVARVAANTPSFAIPAQGLATPSTEERQQVSTWAADSFVAVGYTQPIVGGNVSITLATTLGFYANQTVRVWATTAAEYTRYGTYTINSITRPSATLTAVHTVASANAQGTISLSSVAGFTVGQQIQAEQGLWGEITAIAGNDITYTAYSRPYNIGGTNLAIGVEINQVGAATVNVTLTDAPIQNVSVSYITQQTSTSTNNVPTGAVMTNKTMLDRIPLTSNLATFEAVGSRSMMDAVINNQLSPNTENTILAARAAGDYLRYAIGMAVAPSGDFAQLTGGGLYEGAKTISRGTSRAVDSLVDILRLEFFSPMDDPATAAWLTVIYTRGVLNQ